MQAVGAKKQKENTKKREPEYFITQTNVKAINYKVYYLSTKEKIQYFILAFIVGAFVMYLFYGGLGKNEFGEATRLTYILDISLCSIMGIVAGIVYLPQRAKQLQKKRVNTLRLQFRELLDSLSTSIGSGKTVVDSFRTAQEEMLVIYPEDSYIVKEIEIINTGLLNNINIEVLLMDLGQRSGDSDIMSFASVFEVCYRKGGNIRDIIKSTHQIISEKMEIELKIETIVTASKMEQTLMMFMPIALISIIKMMSPEFAGNFLTPMGLVSTTIAIALFVLAYFIGKEVLDIKI